MPKRNSSSLSQYSNQEPPSSQKIPPLNLKAIWGLIKEAFAEWNEDKASRLAAALAYYTVFSIAPLLIIVIAIAGFVFGEEAARGQIVGQIQGLVGRSGAEVIETAIENANQPTTGTFASIISIIALIFGATGVFGQLRDALNTVWEVQPKPGGTVKGFVRQNILSFTMVLGIGFLLLVSLVISAALAGINSYFSHLLPPGFGFLWQIVNFIISFGVTALLFAMIFRILPDVRITWNDVWIGAAITSLLFSIGRYLLGLYLGNSSFGSTYGAAGSLVIVLAWVYYATQILLFGAEFTQVYARKYGSQIVPDKHAIPVTEETRAQQGIPHRENVEAEESDRGGRVNRRRSRGSGLSGFLRRLGGKRKYR